MGVVVLNSVWLCDPMDCSPPSSSVHRISQARILGWVAISYSRGSSQLRDWSHVSCVSCIGRWILYCWTTQEVLTATLLQNCELSELLLRKLILMFLLFVCFALVFLSGVEVEWLRGVSSCLICYFRSLCSTFTMQRNLSNCCQNTIVPGSYFFFWPRVGENTWTIEGKVLQCDGKSKLGALW